MPEPNGNQIASSVLNGSQLPIGDHIEPYWSEHVKEHARALVVIFAGALALPEPEVMSFMVIQLSGSIR